VLRRILSDPIARKLPVQDSMDIMRMHVEMMQEEYAYARDAPDVTVLGNGIKCA
jgi:hypothetical protein